MSDNYFDGFEETSETLQAYVPDEEANDETVVEILTLNDWSHIRFEKRKLEHKNWNEEWEKLLNFLGFFPTTSFHLVVGNHDILPSEKYQNSSLKVHAHSLVLGSMLLSHEPTLPPEGFLTICGHIHPGILLKGRAKQRVRIPCFHYSDNVLVLPSFGNFTGLSLIKGEKNDFIWGISEDRLIPILSPPVIG